MTSRQKAARKRAVITAIPLVLVNYVAFAGQYAYINDHVSGVAAVPFALALESIALYLGYMAHQALIAEDSAYGLRLASYAFGAIIGAMNYSHYAGLGMTPTFEAVATGLMSIASPWLWGIYSRRQSRDVLKAKGLITPRAVRLGPLRWVLWTGRSWKVFRWAIWRGINQPDEALAHYEVTAAVDQAVEAAQLEAQASDQNAILANEPTPIEMAQSKADAVKAALTELGESVTAAVVSQWLAERGWEVKPNYVRLVRSRSYAAING